MDNQVFSSTNNSNSHNNSESTIGFQKILIIIAIMLLVSAGIIGAYFLGVKNQTIISDSNFNTSEPFTTEITNSSTPTIFSPSTTGTVFPSKKPSVTTSPNIRTKIITSNAELDGFWNSDNEGNNLKDIRVGRNASYVTRGFVSFDLSGFPHNATIVDVTLKLYQKQTVGFPYSVGKNIKVDHLTYGDSLDSPDYGMPALVSSIAELNNNSGTEWKDVNVTESVKDDLSNARNSSQFRLHYQIEATGGSNAGDFVYFESGDNYLNSENIPQLVIKYY